MKLEVLYRGDNSYGHLLIWKEVDSIRLRELEFVAESDDVDRLAISKEIKKARDLWMRYCNAHEVASLVNEVYAENTLYYNHKPMIVGRQELIKEYDYMSRDSYKLKLTPILLEPVREDLVFEAGQCSGTYGGSMLLYGRKVTKEIGRCFWILIFEARWFLII